MERNELEKISDFSVGEENMAFAHLSLAILAEGTSNEWLEPVTEKEYGKLKN